MVERYRVDGLSSLLNAIEQRRQPNGKLFVLLCGSLDPKTGDSWCPDCVKAEPVIEACVDEVLADGVFIHCTIGDRASWKHPENEFRKHPAFRLTSVPTFIKWGTVQRLGADDCSKESLVRMMLED